MGIRTQTLLRKLKKNISRAEHPRLAGEDDILSRGSHPPSATKKKKQITIGDHDGDSNPDLASQAQKEYLAG
jgi:hypothetical protein